MTSLQVFGTTVVYDTPVLKHMNLLEAILSGVSPLYSCLPDSEKRCFLLHLEKEMGKDITIENVVEFLGGDIIVLKSEHSGVVITQRIRPRLASPSVNEAPKQAKSARNTEITRANKRFANTTRKIESKKRLRQFLRTGIRSEVALEKKNDIHDDDFIRRLSEQQGNGTKVWQGLSDTAKEDKLRVFAETKGCLDGAEELLKKWRSKSLGKIHYSATEGRIFRIGSKVMKPKKNTLARIKEDRRNYNIASNRMTKMGETFANSVYSSGI